MITDADITKLKKTFVTKADLKQELKKYATKEDLKEEIAEVCVEIGELKEHVDLLDEKFDVMLVKIDGIAGAIQDLRVENAAGAVHLARHDRQIAALARAAHVTLPE